MGPPGPNGCAPRPKLLAGPSGSANLVVFPPVLRFSIVKARAEETAQALTAQETTVANKATAAQRRCVDQIIAIPAGLSVGVWSRLFGRNSGFFSCI